jgi:hypothetical protein
MKEVYRPLHLREREATKVERYVLLTIPGPPAWDERLGRILAAGPVLAELIRCRSVEELEVRLTSGRRHSAVVVSRPLPGLAGVPVVVLSREFSLVDLVGELSRVGARPVACRDRWPALREQWTGPGVADGRLIAVCGPGGTGASTVAMALAGGLTDAVLADLALRSDQLVLHGLPAETQWGLFEFLERPRFPDLPVMPGRTYRLLPGLRRPSHWTLVRPNRFDRALDTLRSSCSFVVADITGEFEGEAETGSVDIEERNHMARRVASVADLVLVVGGPGGKGRHASDHVAAALLALGADPFRLLRVVNRAASLGGGADLCLPDVRGADVASALTPALVSGIRSRLDGLASPPLDVEPLDVEPVAIRPGSLGSWPDDE